MYICNGHDHKHENKQSERYIDQLVCVHVLSCSCALNSNNLLLFKDAYCSVEIKFIKDKLF